MIIMTKIEYLRKWRNEIQERNWEREMLMAFKEKQGGDENKDIDALKFNHDREEALIKFIDDEIGD